jgi:hypothetical protein
MTDQGIQIETSDTLEKHRPSICVNADPNSNVMDSILASAKQDAGSICTEGGTRIDFTEHLEKQDSPISLPENLIQS